MNLREIIKEEINHFDWLKKDIEPDLAPGEKYSIKSSNDMYWVDKIFYYKGDTGYYWFGDIDSDGPSERMSSGYIKNRLNNNSIRFYDKNWDIKNELVFSDNLKDVLKGNFVINFSHPVKLDQTISLQKKLWKLGFSFYSKEIGELVTNKNTNDDIIQIESFDWDISKQAYKSMPKNGHKNKKMLLVKYTEIITFDNQKLNNQSLYNKAVDHKAIIINGDKFLDKNTD